MSRRAKIAKLKQVVAMLAEADVLLQLTLGADDDCYHIHTQIGCAMDDVEDVISELDNAQA